MDLRKVEESKRIVRLEVNINLLEKILIRKIKIIKLTIKKILKLILTGLIYITVIICTGTILGYIGHILYDIL